MIRNLRHDIDAYLESVSDEKGGEKTTKSREKKQKSREKILELLSGDGSLSAAALAARIGITPKAVEKHLARLKAEGRSAYSVRPLIFAGASKTPKRSALNGKHLIIE